MSKQIPEGWQLHSIGALITESRIPLSHDDPAKRLAVKLHLKGVEKRQERATDGVGSTTYFERRKGQFIYGKQNLHKGALGIIPDAYDGYSSSQDIPTFDFSDSCDPGWFLQYFKQVPFYKSLEKIASGTGSKRIQPKDLLLEKIVCPPLPEQKKIASILTSVDEVIENTQKQIDKLQDLKKATMNELLTKGIGHTEFKGSELGRIPKSWEVKKLNELSDGRFGIVDGPFGSNLKTEHYKPYGVPVIQSGFVTTGHFKAESYVYVDEEKFQSEIRSSVKSGDLVMAKIGAQAGRCTIMPPNHPVGILAGNSLKISTQKDVLLTEYLYQLFTHLYSTGEMQNLRTETAQPAINIATLKRYKIAVPSVGEQKKIIKTLSSVDFQILSLSQKLYQTQSLKKALMQDLLIGKVRVNVN